MDALTYARRLVSFESTSNLSNLAVSDYAEEALREIGFVTERVEFDDPDGIRKANIVGRKGTGSGGMAYFGHTDVVPADDWFSDEFGPFEPTVRGTRLYGRGSCDMKGSIACVLAAAGRFEASSLAQPLYVTCTADEEVGYRGARRVAEESELYREMVEGEAKGVIGEPTLLEVVHAHKGTCGFIATSHGQSAHSSTREGLNANLAMIPFLAEMKRIHDETESDLAWQNDEFDPPTVSWNIGINDYTYAINIKPPQSVCTVYFRPMPGQNPDELLQRVEAAGREFGVEVAFQHRGEPLYVDPESAIVREVLVVAERSKPATVCYGTDGSVLTGMRNLVVFGPGSIAQAHTKDEFIELDQLEQGTDAYARLIQRWCC